MAHSISFPDSNPSLYTRILKYINSYNELEVRVKNIATSILSTENNNDLTKVFQISQSWSWSSKRMKNLVTTLPPQVIFEHLKALVASEEDLKKEISFFINSLSNEKLIHLCGFDNEENASAWFKSRGLVDGIYDNHVTKNEIKKLFNEFKSEAIQVLNHMLSMLIKSLGLDEVGPEKISRFNNHDGGSYSGQNSIENYWKIGSYPLLISAFIYGYINFQPIAIALTGVISLAAFISLVVYKNYLLPCPKNIEGLKEMLPTHEPLFPRFEILQKIEKAFQDQKGVILVGESGCGKTYVVNSLVNQIHEGKICKHIKYPHIFKCNGIALKGGPEGQSISKVDDIFKKHLKQVVLFVDEVHTLFEENDVYSNSYKDELKTLELKNLIGATTTLEYQKYIEKHPTIVGRRFTIIRLDRLKEEELTAYLSRLFTHLGPEIEMENGVLKYIVENSENFNRNTSQVDASVTLLKRVIAIMKNHSNLELDTEIAVLESKLNRLKAELANLPSNSEDIARFNADIISATKRIETLNRDLSKRKEDFKKLHKSEAQYIKLKIENAKLASKNSSEDSKIAKVFLARELMIKLMAENIASQRKRLNMPVRLDRASVDKIITENKSSPIEKM